jgi:hypothetical protein
LHLAMNAVVRTGEEILDATVELVQVTTEVAGAIVVVAGKKMQSGLIEALGFCKYFLFILMIVEYGPQIVELVEKAIRVWRRAQKATLFECGQNPEANIPPLDILIPMGSWF